MQMGDVATGPYQQKGVRVTQVFDGIFAPGSLLVTGRLVGCKCHHISRQYETSVKYRFRHHHNQHLSQSKVCNGKPCYKPYQILSAMCTGEEEAAQTLTKNYRWVVYSRMKWTKMIKNNSRVLLTDFIQR